MRLRKHVGGFALFSIILASAVVINNFFAGPPGELDTVGPVPAAPEPPPVAPTETALVTYDVRLVSLDFINGKSYTTLVLKREAGRPAPDMIEVVTDFYVPDDKQRSGSSTGTRLYAPFDAGNLIEVTAAADCDWCSLTDVPKAGYFADVHVRSLQAGKVYVESLKPSPVVPSGVPVVVQAKREPRR